MNRKTSCATMVSKIAHMKGVCSINSRGELTFGLTMFGPKTVARLPVAGPFPTLPMSMSFRSSSSSSIAPPTAARTQSSKVKGHAPKCGSCHECRNRGAQLLPHLMMGMRALTGQPLPEDMKCKKKKHTGQRGPVYDSATDSREKKNS